MKVKNSAAGTAGPGYGRPDLGPSKGTTMTRPTPRPFRHLAVAAGALALALSTLVGASTSATAAAPVVRPALGDCHALTVAEGAGVSDPDPAVACSTKHTSRTVHVSDLPAGVDQSSYEEVAPYVAKRCGPAVDKAIGGTEKTRYLTAFSSVWFQPTAAQQADGARWIRCDVVLLSGKSYAPLPNDKQPAIGSGKIPDSVAKCRTVKAKDFYVTPCASKHDTRVKGVFTLPGKKYPSDKARQNAAMKKCPKITGSKTKWLMFSPSEDAWKSGSKFFACDLITKR